MRDWTTKFFATVALPALLTVLMALWCTNTAFAYDRYSVNKDATNCRACHGPFGGPTYTSKVDGSAWITWWGPASLHDGHQEMGYDGSTYGCAMCHTYDNFPVKLKTSRGTAPFNVGCLACHGRVEGGVVTGTGLMQRHYRRGITGCANCHTKANPANYTPVGENVQPPGYFTPDPTRPNKPTDSCNRNGAETRYGSSRGLDLDGDLLDDLADPDCSTSTAPDTTITGSPPNPSGSGSATFSFTSNDAAATFECDLDGSGYAVCASPKTYAALAGGAHAFSVRAKDPAGNIDPSPASYAWTIDTTAPDTTITGSPPNPSGSGSATFSFTSNDAAATFECNLDGSGYAVCASPKTYPALAGGAHAFSVRARDAAGNADPTPAAYAWSVVTTLSCWDRNANGYCDLASEDMNGDGVCDTLDCQSTSVSQVYDAGGQYLGKFLGYAGGSLNILVPFLRRSVGISPDDGEIDAGSLYFSGVSCGGTEYVESRFTYSIFWNAGAFYAGSPTAPVQLDNIESTVDPATGQCIMIPVRSGIFVTAVDILLPFQTPVALPLRID